MHYCIIIAVCIYWAFCTWFTTRGALKYIWACRACDRLVAVKIKAPYGFAWDAFQLPSPQNRIPDAHLLVRAVVIAPIRSGLYLLSSVCLCLMLVVCPRSYAQSLTSLMSNVILYILGLSVEVCGRPASGSDAPVIVANHVGMIDVMILLASEQVSFLSDIGIGSFYLIGGIWSFVAAKIGCVFVSRKDESSRSSVKSVLRERISLIRNGVINERLVLFPEGTTSNGTGLVSFKNGAFENLTAVQPVVLLYEDKQWGYCSVWSDVYFAYIMALPPSTVVVHYLEVMKPKEGDSIQDFSDRVRTAMLYDSALKDWKTNNNPTRSHNHISSILTQYM